MPRKRRSLPWLAERGGVYYAHWYDDAKHRTERVSLRTEYPREAAAKFAAFLTQGADVYQVRGEQRPSRLTLRQGFDFYLAEHVENHAVARPILIAIEHLCGHFGEDVPVADLNIPASRGYAAARRLKGIQDSTIRVELSRIVAMVNHNIRWKRLKHDDAPSIELPDAGEPKPRWLTHDELARLRAAARGRTLAFIELAYYTASRRTALERLTWFQVDLDNARITLAQPGERQTKKRRPVVPIDVRLMPTLRRLYAEKRNEWVLGMSGTVVWAFNAAVKRAGLEDVTPHTLRHTRATHLLQDGASLWSVAGLLGDTMATTEKVYGHHSPAHIEAVLGRKEEER